MPRVCTVAVHSSKEEAGIHCGRGARGPGESVNMPCYALLLVPFSLPAGGAPAEAARASQAPKVSEATRRSRGQTKAQADFRGPSESTARDAKLDEQLCSRKRPWRIFDQSHACPRSFSLPSQSSQECQILFYITALPFLFWARI